MKSPRFGLQANRCHNRQLNLTNIDPCHFVPHRNHLFQAWHSDQFLWQDSRLYSIYLCSLNENHLHVSARLSICSWYFFLYNAQQYPEFRLTCFLIQKYTIITSHTYHKKTIPVHGIRRVLIMVQYLLQHQAEH